MEKREQPTANDVVKTPVPAKPPESDSQDSPICQPPSSSGHRQPAPQQPPASNVPRQLTPPQPSQSCRGGQPAPQQPPASNGSGQLTPPQPPESCRGGQPAPQQSAQPKDTKGPSGEAKSKSKKKQKQKSTVPTENLPMSSKGEQTISKPGLANSKMAPQGNHEAIPPALENWSSLLREEEPATLNESEYTVVVYKEKRPRMAKANRRKRQTEGKQCAGPKEKSDVKCHEVDGTEGRSTTQSSERPKKIKPFQPKTTSAEARQPEKRPDDGAMASLPQTLCSMTIGEEEKASIGAQAEFDRPVDASLAPTSGEMEKLFFEKLEMAFPYHFSIKDLRPIQKNGRVCITNAHDIVRDCPEGTTYPGLFGNWTEAGGYTEGPIVEAIDGMVPFLKTKSINGIKQAKGYLYEACLLRRKELRINTPSYATHLHMVQVVRGTLEYFEKLVKWLTSSDSTEGPWVPLGQRPNGNH